MITDNTAKWRVKKVTEFIGNSLPIGHFYQTISPTVPAGSLPLFGGTYSRTLYADLWTWIQQSGLLITESAWQSKATANEGNVPFFSQGDGSTTFRVPSMKCWVKGANGIEEVGSYLKAGLPNITGGTGIHLTHSGAHGGEGAFYWGTHNGKVVGVSGNDQSQGVMLDASRSNSIYGNSDTVQPKSIVGMWCVVAYGTVSNVGNADVANVMTAVEQVQTELQNKFASIKDTKALLNYGAKVTISNNYTAPSDGMVFLSLSTPSQATGSYYVYVNGSAILTISENYYNGTLPLTIPVSKSDVIKWDSGLGTSRAIFAPYK